MGRFEWGEARSRRYWDGRAGREVCNLDPRRRHYLGGDFDSVLDKISKIANVGLDTAQQVHGIVRQRAPQAAPQQPSEPPPGYDAQPGGSTGNDGQWLPGVENNVVIIGAMILGAVALGGRR